MPDEFLGDPETVALIVNAMILENLVKPDSVLCNVSVRSKKHSLEILSELLTRSNPDIASEEVFAKLVERERLSGMDAAKALQGQGWPFKAGLTIPRSTGHRPQAGHALGWPFFWFRLFWPIKKDEHGRLHGCRR